MLVDPADPVFGLPEAPTLDADSSAYGVVQARPKRWCAEGCEVHAVSSALTALPNSSRNRGSSDLLRHAP